MAGIKDSGTNNVGSGVLPKTAYITDVKVSGAQGGTATADCTYATRDLNTLIGDIEFISLSSNQFTLDAGTYEIEASAPARGVVNNHKIRLRNTSDCTTDILGTTSLTGASTSDMGISILKGQITITSSKTFEIQHRVATTNADDGFGIGAGFGDSEVFTSVKITKIA